jgi:hypothetical protein
MSGMIDLFLSIVVAATPSVDCTRPRSMDRPVDTAIVRTIDFDRDGRPDEIRLRVRAARFDRPFARTLTVTVGGREVFRQTAVDSQFDAAFADSAFTTPCTGYSRCKCEWYFTDFLTQSVLIADPASPGDFNAALSESTLVKDCGASAPAAREAVALAKAQLRRERVPLLSEVISPIQGSVGLHHWFAAFECFAPIYRP